MWCFYLPGHLTTTFAKQLLKIWEKYELLLFWASRNSGYFRSSGTSKLKLWRHFLPFRVTLAENVTNSVWPSWYKATFCYYDVTLISGYFPEFRDLFDFLAVFKAFRVTLGKNVINNFWLVWSQATFAWKILPDFRPELPDFLHFQATFEL